MICIICGWQKCCSKGCSKINHKEELKKYRENHKEEIKEY